MTQFRVGRAVALSDNKTPGLYGVYRVKGVQGSKYTLESLDTNKEVVTTAPYLFDLATEDAFHGTWLDREMESFILSTWHAHDENTGCNIAGFYLDKDPGRIREVQVPEVDSKLNEKTVEYVAQMVAVLDGKYAVIMDVVITTDVGKPTAIRVEKVHGLNFNVVNKWGRLLYGREGFEAATGLDAMSDEPVDALSELVACSMSEDDFKVLIDGYRDKMLMA